MRCNFVACFVLGLATVVYTAPVVSRRDAGFVSFAGLTSPLNQDVLASMASLETRSVAVVFEFIRQHAAEAVPSSSKAVKDQAAESSAQLTVKKLFQALDFENQLKPGSIFGGTPHQAEGRIDFVASNVPGFDGRCQGWATPRGNGELQGEKGGKTEVISVENGVKQVKGS
ncbi:hypothetical protein F5876DRAFT_76156 [Lentinula aff. lateritia]|uniref:Uncharacterized protein n=1 Tax=Lentinula aff. lateritia TaxID=2804960 RepID=A0ACC1U2D3_9AGAR|nr:hypothetical protein F5876DRAFT_76156 [Lentinula aff. lateritia]